MKKISMMVIALLAAMTMSATVVSFDFSNPTSMGLTPSSKTSDGVSLNSDTITVGDVAMSFNVPSGNGAKLWTASGPAYTLRLYMPSSMILTSSGDNIRGIRVTRSQGDITELVDNEWRGNAKSVTLSVPDKGKANYITVVTVYVGEEMPTTTIDTISVSEARQRIDAKKLTACYIKAVVAGTPFVASSRNCIWLTDINNPGDSIEGFGIRKGKASKETYPSLDSMAVDLGLQDTVLVYADALAKFNSIYEMAGGYYVSTISKSSAINANAIFKHAVGARQWGRSTTDSTRYKYEIVLSKVSAEEYSEALHMIINTKKELGIDGKYTVRNYMSDSSYVDGAGGVGGSLTLTYIEEAGTTHNKYAVQADFTVGSQLYHMDTTFNIAGWDYDYTGQFKLSDDVPFVPKDGDTITCEQALSYAKSLGSVASELTVWVHGYATGFQTIKGRTQQSVYMADDASATSGIFMGYLCYTQNLDSIIKGDEVLVKGKISYYESKSLAQISKGNIYRIGGSSTKRARTINCVEIPAGAITVAEAIEIGNALQAEVGQTVSTATEYTVYGYIVDVNRQTSQDSATWYMHDVKGEYGDFKAYKCYIPNLIDEDDMVFVTGYISKYQKSASEASIEIAKGAANFACEPTGLEQLKAVVEKTGAKKVLMNGRLFIVKDDMIYNAQGAVIR